MAVSERIQKKLSTVFSPPQAQVLAEVIWEDKEDIKNYEISELKNIVKELAVSHLEFRNDLKELAEAQKELKVELKELAEAQKEVKLALKELAEAQKELKVELKELAEAQKELKVEIKELAESQKELAFSQSRTERELRNLARQVGGLSEAFGGSLEDYAIDLVPEVLENHWGMVVEDSKRENLIINEKLIEIDLVIRGAIGGKPTIVLGEVKSNLTKNEVNKFLTIIDEIKSSDIEEFNLTEIRVIFFGYRAQKEAMDIVREHNCYMISTRGKIL